MQHLAVSGGLNVTPEFLLVDGNALSPTSGNARCH